MDGEVGASTAAGGAAAAAAGFVLVASCQDED